jgi:pyruvate/2-oxoglutarate dehydrogenase complex dihydrolipoamide acyltransferase (E2) component
MSVHIGSFDRRRRHTLFFLAEIRSFAPVFLDTEIDMSAVLADRAAAGARRSIVSYVVHAGARALAAHPDANVAIRGGWRPRIATADTVTVKLALDRVLGGRRVVLAGLLPDVDRADLGAIQELVDRFRGDPDTMPDFAGVRALHRLPGPVGRLAFRATARPLRRRAALLGTLAVTSLGHRPVDGFHSVGGTTVTLGVGRILDRPVVRAGAVTVAPVMRLNLCFDHRVIDGAEAADLLADIKDRLETFPTAQAATEAAEPALSRGATLAGSAGGG